jgi:hypothetical protein
MTAVNNMDDGLQLQWIDTTDTLKCCNQNSHFRELDAGNDMAKATSSEYRQLCGKSA